MISRMKKSAVVLALAATLGACGGGGGGDGGVTPGPAAPIAGANYQTVAQDALQSSSFLFDGTSQATMVAAVRVDERALMNVARAEQAKLPTYFANAPTALAGATQSQTSQCASGGSVTVTVNDADNNGAPSAGDSVSISFSSCNDGTSVVNGTLGFAVDAFSTGNSQLTMSFNLSVSMSGSSASANGSVSVGTISNSTTGDFSQTISVPATLSMTVNNNGVVRGRSLTNYDATFAHTSTQDSYQVVSGTLKGWNTLASVEVTVSTPTPFVRYAADTYPSVGQMLLTGQNGAHLLITAVDNANAQLEVDVDGDNVYETGPYLVAWYTLLN